MIDQTTYRIVVLIGSISGIIGFPFFLYLAIGGYLVEHMSLLKVFEAVIFSLVSGSYSFWGFRKMKREGWFSKS